MPRPRSEEIPLELIKKAPSSVIDMAPKISIMPRPQTPHAVIEPEPSTSSENQSSVISNVTAATSWVSEETSFIARETSKDGVETV
nr:unnamed protein product [Callosobruchus analis]